MLRESGPFPLISNYFRFGFSLKPLDSFPNPFWNEKSDFESGQNFNRFMFIFDNTR